MPSTSAIRLLQLTDSHLFGAREAALRGVQPFATLQAVQAHAAKHFVDIDGVLLTGDLVHDDAQGYQLIREAFSESSVPVYCIPGNHDIPDKFYHYLADKPFVVSQLTVIKQWIIVLLNSWVANAAGGELGTEQLAEIDAVLNNYPHHHALLCLHHHPVNMDSRWLDQVGLNDAAALRSCIGKHPNIRGVVWGHVHQALDKVIDGVHYMATPATCAQFLPHSDNFAVDTRPPGYRTLELLPDGAIVTKVNWLD